MHGNKVVPFARDPAVRSWRGNAHLPTGAHQVSTCVSISDTQTLSEEWTLGYEYGDIICKQIKNTPRVQAASLSNCTPSSVQILRPVVQVTLIREADHRTADEWGPGRGTAPSHCRSHLGGSQHCYRPQYQCFPFKARRTPKQVMTVVCKLQKCEGVHLPLFCFTLCVNQVLAWIKHRYLQVSTSK